MYYIYRHIRLDKNEVFYIGKGTIDKRRKTFIGRYFRSFDKKHRNNVWKRITSKTEYLVEIIFESECEQTTFKKEMEFIKLYGRKDLKNGTLANLTDGGEGYSDRNKIIKRKKKPKEIKIKKPFKHTEESRKKISEARKGKGNGMYGKKGKLHPNYGKEVPEELKRRYEIEYSSEIKVIFSDNSYSIFKCTSDCAYFFGVTSSMIRSTIRNNKKGIFSKRGKFSDKVLINNDKD